MSKATLSVAFIVKDEEIFFKRTLESIRDVVDEIVVLVDDSTTDRTYEIAKEYADVLDYFKWKADFAKHRNDSIARCSKDWVMIMDGHEILHPASKPVLTNLMARILIEHDKKHPEGLADALFFSGYAYMLEKFPETEQEYREIIPEIFFPQPRIFRRSEFGLEDGKLHYEGRSHNYIIGGSKDLKRYPVRELVFLHARDKENARIRKEQRAKMNVENLKKDIEANPKKPRPYFYLAQTYLDLGDKENAKTYYEKYLNLDDSKWPDERAQAFIALSTIHANDKEYEKAEKLALRSLQERWDRAEIYMILGDIALDMMGNKKEIDFNEKAKLAEKAMHWYKAASDMKPPFSSLFLHGPAYSYLPFERMARLCDMVGDWEKAIENGLKVLKIKPSYHLMAKNIRLWKSRLGVNPDKHNVLIFARGDTFVKPIAEGLAREYNVKLGPRYSPDALRFCDQKNDVVWFEWCDVNAIEATNRQKPPNQKWIVRLHSYEAYTEQPNAVDWSKIDHLIYVADHIKRKAERRYPRLKSVSNTVIHNGVDTEQYAFALRKPGFNVGYVGIFSWKKGIQLLVQTLRWLKKRDPRYVLHARMDFFEGDSTVRQAADYWDYCYPEFKDNLRFYPKREKNLDGWLEDMNFVLSTSTIEAFSYYVAEAMLKGIKPLIYDWEGSSEVWPKELIWRDFDELDEIMSGEYDSRKYHDYVVMNYSKEKQMSEINALLKKLMRGD